MTAVAEGGVASVELRLAAHRVAPTRVEQIMAGVGDRSGRLGAHPLRNGVLFGIVAFLLSTLGGAGVGSGLVVLTGHNHLKDEAGNLGTDVTGTIVVVALLTALGLWRRVGFAGPTTWTDLRLLIFPAALTLVPLVTAGYDLRGAGKIALAVPQPLLTGFWEEGFTRGFLLYAVLVALLRSGRSPIAAVWLCAGVFGVMHAVALVGGKDAGSVLSQVIYAALFGVGAGAVLLRTNALWLLVVIHALFDVGETFSTAESSGFSIGAILFSLPLAIYGMVLLRERRETATPSPPP